MATAKLTVEMGRDIADAPEQQKQLLTEVKNLEPLLKGFRDRIGTNPSANVQQFEGPLVQFEKTMTRVTKKLQSPQQSSHKRIWKRMTWTLWNKKEAEDNLAKMERFKSLLNSWLVLDIWYVSPRRTSNTTQVILPGMLASSNKKIISVSKLRGAEFRLTNISSFIVRYPGRSQGHCARSAAVCRR
jgi:hypothetical protein